MNEWAFFNFLFFVDIGWLLLDASREGMDGDLWEEYDAEAFDSDLICALFISCIRFASLGTLGRGWCRAA